MKHSIISSLFVTICGAMAFTSCSSEIAEDVKTPNGGKQQMTFSAQYDNNPISSRTSLGDNYSVLWSENDELSVFDGEGNNSFAIVPSGVGKSSANFDGSAKPGASKYYALYPYQSGAELDGSTIKNVKIPSTQTATAGTFDPKANIMTAVANDAKILAFKNVCSYAKITTTTACKYISISTGTDSKISGTFNLSVDDEGIATTTPVSAYGSVRLSADEGFEAGTYYIAINATTLSSLTVYCCGLNGKDLVRYITPSTPITAFTRGSIIDLGTASVENGWKDPDVLCPDGNHPHAIDLGLSVKWACCNVGAGKPSDYGNYYAWGVTETQTRYGHDYYKFGNRSYNLTKYGSDGKKKLDPEDDVARVKWGGEWRMPTSEELKELRLSARQKTTIDGVFGVKLSTMRGSVFLPCAGYIESISAREAGVNGCYWSSDQGIGGTYYGYILKLETGYDWYELSDRVIAYGCSVRPVCP